VAYQHVREAPQPPSYYDPEVPPVVDAIVMKALAKSPDERYQSADEMRADLERALDGRPVAAAPTVAAGFGAAAPTAVMAPPGGRGYSAGGGYGSAPAQTRYEQNGYQNAAEERLEDEIPRSRRAQPATGGRKANKNDRTGWVILGVVVVVLVVLAGLVYKTVFSGSTGTTGTVPTITGLTVTQAKQTLKDSNYELGSSFCGAGKSSNAIPAGQIEDQNPRSGASQKTGTSVNYCVSSGPVVNTMPTQSDVNSAAGTQVVNTLTSDGYLSVSTKTEASNSVPSGNAITIQDKNGNSELGKDVPVTTPLVVVISSGPNSQAVPSVANENCDQAKAALAAAPYDFNVSEQNQYSPIVPQNSVISTNPSGGATAAVGSQVTLVCSSGPSPQQTTPTTNPTPTSTNTGGGFLGGLGGPGGPGGGGGN
jgi:serine/threonine-protein kinase